MFHTSGICTASAKKNAEDSFSEEALNHQISKARNQEDKLEKAHSHFLDAVAAKGKGNWPVVIFSLLKSAMASAMQRRLYFDYALAKWVKIRWRWLGV